MAYAKQTYTRYTKRAGIKPLKKLKKLNLKGLLNKYGK